MQVYVRLGIRLLYKGAKSHMEGNRGTHSSTPLHVQLELSCCLSARSLLKSMSVKQGLKYDAPESAKDIPAFIEFHNLNANEILDPLNSFKSFNEFFYRYVGLRCRPILTHILTLMLPGNSNPRPGLSRVSMTPTALFPVQTVD